ncbi:BUD16 [Sanghuangporus vaninii]
MGSRVLSIQSHVTYGYVGGKAAVFPLQCLGYDVDAVNTVDFSNHSGYGRFGGSRATAQDLATIFDTMEANGLLTQERIVTGYIPGAEALSVVARLVKKVKLKNPDIIYLLDPVLGDSGKLYVTPDVIPIYRKLLPQATVITPNWFEVETLTDIPLKDMHSLRRALKILHEEYHVPHVVMSSIPLHDFFRDALPPHFIPEEEDPTIASSSLLCISSTYNTCANGSVVQNGINHTSDPSEVHAHVLPCIPGYFSGVGDLFSALVLAHFQPTPGSSHVSTFVRAGSSSLPSSTDRIESSTYTPLSIAVSYALSKTFGILKFTHEQILAQHPASEDATDEERDRTDPERRVRRMRTRELRLIQGQHILRAAPKLISNEHDGGDNVVQLCEMRPWNNFWR